MNALHQVMVRLLESLTDPPAADTVSVRTAAAAVEELCVLEVYSWGKGSGDGGTVIGGSESVRGRTHASVVGDPALQALPRGGLWGPGTRNQRFAAMLTDAYARSAGTILLLMCSGRQALSEVLENACGGGGLPFSCEGQRSKAAALFWRVGLLACFLISKGESTTLN